nr:hypothetical protein StreXyl84_80010 [Streptomyces sp. Xyl84]
MKRSALAQVGTFESASSDGHEHYNFDSFPRLHTGNGGRLSATAWVAVHTRVCEDPVGGCNEIRKWEKGELHCRGGVRTADFSYGWAGAPPAEVRLRAKGERP